MSDLPWKVDDCRVIFRNVHKFLPQVLSAARPKQSSNGRIEIVADWVGRWSLHCMLLTACPEVFYFLEQIMIAWAISLGTPTGCRGWEVMMDRI